MAIRRRNIGREILDGIREIKRGEHGLVTTVPSVSNVREKTVAQSERVKRAGSVA